jgi:hypothetical protein
LNSATTKVDIIYQRVKVADRDTYSTCELDNITYVVLM